MPSISITAKELRRLLEKDGWEVRRWANHGLAMTKTVTNGRTRSTIIPRRGILAGGTLSAILGSKQTGIGRAGLERLIDRHGK